jgi:hypothetical protein
MANLTKGLTVIKVRCTGCGQSFVIDDCGGLWARAMGSDDPPVYLCNQCKIDNAELADEELFDETVRGRC